MQNVINEIPGVCCCCWLLPVVLVVLPIMLGRMIQTAWGERGMERGRLYCAGCRFDLRGGSGMTCPECGSALDGSGIFEAGLERPHSVGVHLIVAILVSVVPLGVIGYVVLGMIPVNYVRETSVYLDNPFVRTPQVNEINAAIDIRHSRWTRGPVELDVVLRGPNDWVRWRLDPDADFDALYSAEAFERACAEAGIVFDKNETQEKYRAQFVEVLQQLSADPDSRPTQHWPLKVRYHSDLYFEPSPWFVIPIVLLGIAAFGLIINKTLKYSEREQRKYHKRLESVAERYRRQVAAGGPSRA